MRRQKSGGSQGGDRNFMEDVPGVWERDKVEAVQGSSCLQVFEALSPIFSKGVGARICSGGLRQWNWRSQ